MGTRILQGLDRHLGAVGRLCASTAHCTASTALPNSARTLSPAVFAMRPLCSPMILSKIARRSVSPLSVRLEGI
jgi:hypothetical protein